MRIYNMKTRIARKMAACVILACGFLSTSFLYSFEEIALGDPSFEAFVVPASGYAYADSYRPTSAWIDDQDSPGGYVQDDANSNWLYSTPMQPDFAQRLEPAIRRCTDTLITRHRKPQQCLRPAGPTRFRSGLKVTMTPPHLQVVFGCTFLTVRSILVKKIRLRLLDMHPTTVTL